MVVVEVVHRTVVLLLVIIVIITEAPKRDKEIHAAVRWATQGREKGGRTLWAQGGGNH